MAQTLSNPSVEKSVWGSSDLPPFVPHDRRITSNRRVEWRGGRRDGDWLCRPLGKLATFEKTQRRPAIWRRVFLGLWWSNSLPACSSTAWKNAGVGSSSTASWAKTQLSML